MHNGNTRRRREKGTKEILEKIMPENFPKFMRPQSTDPESSENMTQDKSKISTLRHITFKLQKIKDKGKILKETRGRSGEKKKRDLQRNKDNNYIRYFFKNHTSKKTE